MLKRLYIHNYKCLVDFELELGPLNVFVGENGSGKSAVVDALLNLRAAASGDFSLSESFAIEKTTGWLECEPQVIELEVYLSNKVFVYRIEVAHGPSGNPRVMSEQLSCNDSSIFAFDGQKTQYKETDASSQSPSGAIRVGAVAEAFEEDGELGTFKKWLLSYQATDFGAGNVEPRYLDSTFPFRSNTIYQNGWNFVSWLAKAADERQDLWKLFKGDIQDAIQGLEGLELVDDRLVATCATNSGQHNLEFSELSSGQKSLIFHYAVLHFLMKDGNFVAFDEPDNFVALREIQPWLLDVEERCANGDAQCVIISHNPEVIDCLGREYGIYFYRDEKGATRTKPLNEVIPPDSDLSLSGHISNGWVNMEAK